MKKLLISFILVVLVVPVSIATTEYFADVEDGIWYEEAVYNLVEKGIVVGDRAYYRPGDPVNRAEMAQIIDNLVNYLEDEADVSDGTAEDVQAVYSIPSDNDGFSLGNDMYEDVLFLDGDILYVNVGYSGGCGEHDFDLLWDGSFQSAEDEDQVDLYLKHEGYGDMCEAYISTSLKFDLSVIKETYIDQYDELIGVIELEIIGSSGASEKIDYSF